MFNCYLLFENAELIGKYSIFLSQIHPNMAIHSALDIGQLKLNPECTNILISNESGLKQVNDGLIKFNKSYIFKKDVDTNDGDIHYLDPKFVITKMGTYLLDFIQDELKILPYAPIDIKKIKYTNLYPCSFYIKLQKGKHLKISNAHEGVSESILQKLIFKGAKYLYVPITEYNDFIQSILKSKTQPPAETSQALEKVKSVEAVHDYITEMGFDPKIINMTKALHKSLEEKYKTKYMKNLLQQFSNLEGSFLYNHSYLASVLALTVGKNFTWMNYENREKIYLGCILHDLGYTDKENANYEQMSKQGVETLDEKSKDDVLNHPLKFALKLAQVQDIHQDVIQIVRDHHGVHGEKSYPKPILAHEINLIFALFVLSHEFALKLYAISFNPKKIPLILDQLIEEFDKGSYKKIIPEFRNTMESIFL